MERSSSSRSKASTTLSPRSWFSLIRATGDCIENVSRNVRDRRSPPRLRWKLSEDHQWVRLTSFEINDSRIVMDRRYVAGFVGYASRFWQARRNPAAVLLLEQNLEHFVGCVLRVR